MLGAIPPVDLPTWTELRLVMPELVLTVGMVIVLMGAMAARGRPGVPIVLAMVTAIAGMVAVGLTMFEPAEAGIERLIFHQTLAIDPFSQFFKLLLMLTILLVLIQWMGLHRGQDDLEPSDWPDYACLLLGAALGMSLLASARDLLVVLIAMETASLPSYVLAGIRKRRRLGAEASMKFVLIGAVATGLMVYGMSLLYGASGSLKLDAIVGAANDGITPIWAVGMIFLFTGFAFKLSAVPLHFWCPDVFEGAPFDVATFLSVASKGAAVVLLARMVDLFGAYSGSHGGEAGMAMLLGVGIFGAVTATWGNLVALRQTRIRRMLAYSSIAQAGYMIMAVAALSVAGSGHSAEAMTAILFYLTVYLFMNVGAFTLAARISAASGSEEMSSMAGWIHRRPLEVVLLGIFLLSLFGLPTLGGFLGKWYLAVVMGRLGEIGIALVVVLLVNTLFSLAFYLKPLYHMVLQPMPQGGEAVASAGSRSDHSPIGLGVAIVCAAGVFWTGLDLGATSLIRPFGHTAGRGMVETRGDPPAAVQQTIFDKDAESNLRPSSQRPGASLSRTVEFTGDHAPSGSLKPSSVINP
ncbi:MAG: NADH-quinone oxidoreductase subunit N [Phycisphaeraceae bacterium]|nr:NADH-quinone oxidoreductase subunit N [Phycisphaeraceae bacterium]